MNINLHPFFVLWVVLAVVVLALAFWRRAVTRHEDDSLHVMEGEAGAAVQQVAVAHKLDTIDKWGKGLTVLLAVSGVVLAAIYVYQTWVQMSNIGV